MLALANTQIVTEKVIFSAAPISPMLKMRAMRHIAGKHHVEPKFLDYVGIMDASEIGKQIILFNILDPKHPLYKSTKGFPTAAEYIVEAIVANVINRPFALRDLKLFSVFAKGPAPIEILETIDKGPYVLRKEIVESIAPEEEPIEWTMAYTHDGHYIGDPEMATFLFEKTGLSSAMPSGGGNVCNIGFNEDNKKWYGWSHRAIIGFGIGDRIFEKDFGDDNTPYVSHGSKKIKTLDDAKLSARKFAEYIS